MRAGLIGCGNMGEVLLESLTATGLSGIDKVIVSDKDMEKLIKVGKKYAVETFNNVDLAKFADIIILAVKPQDLPSLLKEISVLVDDSSKLMVSIVAGAKLSYLENFFEHKVRVIRVMPNAACLIKEGVSVISRGKYCTDRDINLVKKVFRHMGGVLILNEKFMDVITAVSGSGPGYIGYIAESFINQAVELGVDKEVAKKLVYRVLVGTGKLLEKTNIQPKKLIEKVASKGGTTEAGLKVFKERDIDRIFKEAILAATKRSQEISNRIK